MTSGSIARRYAKALFGLAVEQDRVEPWSDALVALQAAVDGSPDLLDVLSNPVYSRDQRREIVRGLARSLKLDAEPSNLLFLLGDRNRLAALGDIVATFRGLADQKLGRIRAQVTSAVPLDAASQKALAEKLSKATKSQVIVERSVDPELLGGVVARVGSLVFDGSIKSQLEALRRELKQQ
jgi:F-type H+-transporting ATPase subunit delta